MRCADSREAGAADEHDERVDLASRRQRNGVKHDDGAKWKAKPPLYVAFLSLPLASRPCESRGRANAAS